MSHTNKKRSPQEPVNNLDEHTRDSLIEMYLPLINAVAQALASKLPACVDAEDLASVGVMGLIDAIDKYDPAKCDNFKNYARIRIKGAMLDELRSLDWVPRSVRQVATRMERKRRALEQKFGRAVNDTEVADALDMSMQRYHQLRDRAQATGMVPLEDIGRDHGDEQRGFLECIEDDDIRLPDDQAHQQHVLQVLGGAIQNLPERQQMIIGLYYNEGMNLREIGQVLGVTESRVSQIHSKAVKSLRRELRAALDLSAVA